MHITEYQINLLLTVTFPSIDNWDILPPSPTAIDDTSSCNVNLTRNFGGNGLVPVLSCTDARLYRLSCCNKCGSIFCFDCFDCFDFLVLVVLDVLLESEPVLLTFARELLVSSSSSSTTEKGSNGLSARVIVTVILS